MRIGIDARMYSSKFTGIGRYVYELIHNLCQLDQENEYVIFLNEPEYSKFTPPNSRVTKRLVNARHYSLKEQTKFLWILYREKLDLMHFTHFNAPILYFRKSIVTIHDLTLSFFPGKKMNSFIYRLGYGITLKSTVKKAKKIIAVSQNTKKDLIAIAKVPATKVSVVYEGVNAEFQPIKDQSQIAAVKGRYQINKPFILYTGVWRSHKNLPNLIKGFHQLVTQKKLDYQLVITGRQDPLYPEVKQAVQEYNLEDHVIFTGLVPENDLITLYSAADIYAFPSFYEGFGLPVLEAMQCSTPVACSNTSCLPEIAGANNAIFFDPNSAADIAAKIYQLATDKKLYRQLQTNGLNRVKDFSWSQMAQETAELYQQSMAKNPTKK